MGVVLQHFALTLQNLVSTMTNENFSSLPSISIMLQEIVLCSIV